jgi:hypothetical protein
MNEKLEPACDPVPFAPAAMDWLRHAFSITGAAALWMLCRGCQGLRQHPLAARPRPDGGGWVPAPGRPADGVGAISLAEARIMARRLMMPSPSGTSGPGIRAHRPRMIRCAAVYWCLSTAPHPGVQATCAGCWRSSMPFKRAPRLGRPTFLPPLSLLASSRDAPSWSSAQCQDVGR